jgi:iron complex outermembrane receptor protein
MTGAYTDNRFTDYPNAPCTFAVSPGVPPAGNGGTCATGFITPGVPFNGAGLSTNGGPQWTSSLNLNYTRDLNDWLKLSSSIGADSQSHTWIDGGPYNPFYGLQPSYTKVNLRVALGAPDDKWTIALIGNNIFDVMSTSGTFTFPPSQVYVIDEGRRWTIQGSVKF